MFITLASVIKARRLVRGMEQTGLASVIGCDARSVARWEAGELPSARHMAGLRAALDLSICEMDVLVLDHLTGGDARFRIEGSAVLERLSWSYSDLLERIVDLEARANGIVDPRHAGTVVGLSELFEALPDSWRVLTRSDRIMGIWHMTPLSSAAYGELCAGRLSEGEITLDHVETLDLPGEFDVLLSSVAIDRSVRSPRTFALLLGSLIEEVCGLARRGVTLRSVCLQAWTPQIVLMCRRLGFCQIGTLLDAPVQVPILETEVERLLSHPALTVFLPRNEFNNLHPAT